MRKQYSQITFEFQDPPDSGENAGVGVRIKALKKAADQKSEQGTNEDQPPVKQDDAENARLIQYRKPEIIGASEADLSSNSSTDSSDSVSKTDSSVNDETDVDTALNVNGITNNISAIASDASTEDAFDPQFSTRDNSALADEALTEQSTESSANADGVNESSAVELKAVKSTRGRKSLKTIDDGTDLINIPPDEELFKKQYYAIGEVAEMFHVNQSLLRFWETEFDIIQPRKNRKGDRHFRPIDIKNLLLIHDLLRRRKLTIEGAKDFLKKNKRTPERFAMIQSLQKIKGFILEVKATL